MNYFIQEVINDEGLQRSAGIKARDDIDAILLEKGFKPIRIEMDQNERSRAGALKRAAIHRDIAVRWKKELKALQKDDTLLIQFPVSSHSVLLAGQVLRCQKKGVRIILLIHDLELFRHMKRGDVSPAAKVRIRLEERSLLENADCMIAHNRSMKKRLVRMGFRPEKIRVLGIFDYLIPDFAEKISDRKAPAKDLPVCVAGAFRPNKSGYIYDLPDNVAFNLYGIGYEDRGLDNISYHGSFPPDDLPFAMEGSFGLVWDGDSADTCAGTYGEYMRINNPHKTSLYLAAGFPVIIWEESALAGYIRDNGCGLTIASLSELREVLDGVTEEDYEAMAEKARRISARLRRGAYTERVLERALQAE